jgi:hypothetical protein
VPECAVLDFARFADDFALAIAFDAADIARCAIESPIGSSPFMKSTISRW